MIKVIVTGAFSTGKSSTVAALASTLRDDGLSVIQVKDVARSCPLPLNEAQSEATTLWLLTTQVSREIEASSQMAQIVLCDRGVPDILAHDGERDSSLNTPLADEIRPFSEKWIDTYDVILLSRVDQSIPIEPDGLRSRDHAYRTRLDGRATDVLGRRPDTVTLAHSPLERLRQAREAISVSLAASRSAPTRRMT